LKPYSIVYDDINLVPEKAASQTIFFMQIVYLRRKCSGVAQE
jgi:hypothetical protein